MSIHTTHPVDVGAALRAHGAACTAQRRQVWAFFAANPHGYTAGEAVAALRAQGIGQATVYRTLELLTAVGLLTRAQDDARKTRYLAVCPGHSHALICRDCHAVVEFDDCDLSLLEKLLAAQTGYRIDGHHLELYGRCPACAGEGVPDDGAARAAGGCPACAGEGAPDDGPVRVAGRWPACAGEA